MHNAPVLKVEKLRFEVSGQVLINNLSVSLERTKFAMLVGPNGAGKSLLLRLLHGLIEPSAGEILWYGSRPDTAVRRTQAMVFQRPVLLRRTVTENMTFAIPRRDPAAIDACDELLEQVGLLSKSNQPARQLSGGEQQRLALARALALEPKTLFLDEPTASLDPASTQIIEKIVSDFHSRGVMIIFVTHDIGQVRRLANHVVFMNHGEVTDSVDVESFFSGQTSEAANAYLNGQIVL